MHAPPRRALVTLVLALATWALGGYLLVPWLLERNLPGALEARLNAHVSLGAAHFNPFLLDLELEELSVEGPLGDGERAPTERLTIEHLALDLRARTLVEFAPVLAITVTGPKLQLSRDADGTLPALRLLHPRAEVAPTADETPGEPPRLLLSLTLEDGGLIFEDRALASPARLALTLEMLRLEHLDTGAPTRPAPLRFAVGGDAGRLRVEGTLQADGTANVELELREGTLAAAAPWITALTSSMDLAAGLELDASVSANRTRVEATDVQLQLSDLALTLPANSMHIDLAKLDASGGRGRFEFAEPGRSTAALDALELAQLAFTCDCASAIVLALAELRLSEAVWKDGVLSADALGLTAPVAELRLGNGLATAGKVVETTVDTAAEVATEALMSETNIAAVLPFAISLRTFSVDGLALTLQDERLTPAARLNFGDGRARAGPLALDRSLALSKPLSFEFDLTRAETQRLHAFGTAAPSLTAALALDARVEIEALSLSEAGPWVREFTGLELRQAILSSTLTARWEGALSAQGSAWLTGLAVYDPDGMPLFSLGALEVTGINVDSGARSAAVDGIALAAPRLRFARYADGRTNFGALTGKEGASQASEANGDGSAPWTWHIGGLTVERGVFGLVDEALVTPFSTSVEAITGRAGATNSQAPQLALELTGRIPPVGVLRADASLDLSDPLAAARVGINFQRLSFVPLSPYVGTFAGRGVAAGELDLELDYVVEAGRLSAVNKIVLDSLKLGEQVESKQAANLPLELAIALLRDADGRIKLNVPVRGDVTDPAFNLMPVIMHALSGAIAGVVTTPFRLLGSLVGAKQPLDGVDFRYGAATLDASAEKVLVDLAQVLERRPGLTLTLVPVYASLPDRDALRMAELEARIVAIDALRPQALIRLASATLSEDLIDAMHKQYGDMDAAMADALEGLLLERIELAPDALTRLAEARAAAVIEGLAAAGLDASRVTTTPLKERPDLASERVRLPFSLAPRSLVGAT